MKVIIPKRLFSSLKPRYRLDFLPVIDEQKYTTMQHQQ
jgi:hypothetical protein